MSDTKITDTQGGEPTWGFKISIPLQGTPFVIGAAGFTDLFHEFNRKIPLVVGQRLREYQVKNVEALVGTDLTHDEAVSYVLTGGQRLEQSKEPPPIETAKVEEEPKIGLPLPYIYTAENFLDDCKGLVRQITEQADTGYSNPLEALAVIWRPESKNALLHYIDSKGRESSIDTYQSIGSGSPHVKMFFDKLYRFDRPMAELISLAIFTIAFVQRIAKESSVGYTLKDPPNAFGVLPDGRCGAFTINNMAEVLADVDKQLVQYEALIDGFTPTEIKG